MLCCQYRRNSAGMVQEVGLAMVLAAKRCHPSILVHQRPFVVHAEPGRLLCSSMVPLCRRALPPMGVSAVGEVLGVGRVEILVRAVACKDEREEKSVSRLDVDGQEGQHQGTLASSQAS